MIDYDKYVGSKTNRDKCHWRYGAIFVAIGVSKLLMFVFKDVLLVFGPGSFVGNGHCSENEAFAEESEEVLLFVDMLPLRRTSIWYYNFIVNFWRLELIYE